MPGKARGDGRPAVVVVGGGIAGLTVAHECAEAGLPVRVLERAGRWGGKTLGYIDAEGYPTEHSMRAFSSSYVALFETMKRIPFGDGSVLDNLTPLESYVFATRQGAHEDSYLMLETDRPGSQLWNMMSGMRVMRLWGCDLRDLADLFVRTAAFLASGSRRREAVTFKQTLAQFLRFDRRSRAYSRFWTQFFGSITAARPYAGVEPMMNLLAIGMTHITSDEVADWAQSTSFAMDGPTNERFIDPWVEEVRRLGARLELGAEVTEVRRRGDRVEGLAVRHASGEEERVEGDAFVLATHHDVVCRLCPELMPRKELDEDWTAGFQFYLSRVPEPLVGGRRFTFAFDSPWEVVYCVQQAPMWRDIPLPEGVVAVLSVTVSDIEHKPGLTVDRPFLQCTRDEVEQEIRRQLGLGPEDLDAIVGRMRIGPHVHYVTEAEFQAGLGGRFLDWDHSAPLPDGHRWVTNSTLHTKLPERPPIGNETRYDNLWLAGEFTRTPFITFPSMEQVNESGKVCASLILERAGLPYDRSRLELPTFPLALVRWLDDLFWDLRRGRALPVETAPAGE